jgi:hypothetical protein
VNFTDATLKQYLEKCKSITTTPFAKPLLHLLQEQYISVKDQHGVKKKGAVTPTTGQQQSLTVQLDAAMTIDVEVESNESMDEDMEMTTSAEKVLPGDVMAVDEQPAAGMDADGDMSIDSPDGSSGIVPSGPTSKTATGNG